jgi:uncharacterized membrane protein
MDDAGIALLVMALLAVPVLIVILLIVYIVKTNRLTRQVAELESNLRLVSRDVAALVTDARDVQRLRVSPRSSPSSVPIEDAPPATETSEPAPVTEAPGAPQPQGPVAPPPQVPVVSPPVSRPAEATPPVRPELPTVVHVPQQPAVLRPLAESAQAGAGAALPRETLHRVPPPPRAPSRTRAEWEALIGGKLLNRIGALALIIGIGFFLRYAFQNNWITPWMRVGIGILIGGALLIGGGASHKRGLQVFAQGLIGSGIAILYLSVYASFNYYQLVDQKTAFLMMSAVTVVTFSLAFKYNSLAVSFLGWAGGFLTPFMLSTGQANEVGLFSYIALLDAGLLAILAMKEAWLILEPLTLGGTYLVYVLWYYKFYSPADSLTTALFLTIFWLLFFVLDVFRLRRAGAHSEVRQMVAVFNAIFYYLAIYVVIENLDPDWTAPATMIIGAVYLLTIIVAGRGRARDSNFFRFILTAIVFLVLATAIRYSGFKLVFFWSVEGLALIGCAAFWNLRPVKHVALGLFAVTLIKLFATDGALSYYQAGNFTLLANPRALAFIILAASIGLSTLVLKKRGPKTSSIALESLNYGWCLLLFTLIAVETNDYFSAQIAVSAGDVKGQLAFNRSLVLGLVFMGYSVLLVWFGSRARIRSVVLSGLAVLALAWGFIELRSAAFSPIESFTLIANARVGAVVLALAALLIQIRLIKLNAESLKRPGAVTSLLQWAWCILLFTVCTAETNDLFRQRMIRSPGAQSELYFNEFITLAIVWLIYSLPLAWYGLKRRLASVGAAGLLALAAAIVILATSTFSYEPISDFRLLLNYRAAAMAFALIALYLHSEWTKLESERRVAGLPLSNWSSLLRLGIALLALLLMTVETRDYFNRELFGLNQQTKPGVETIAQLSSQINSITNLQQMALSLVWLVYSILLIGFGIWRRVLALRILAIVIFGITILKIFIYDLSFLETLYRIFSFIGLGLILLTVSFLYQRYKTAIFDTGPREPGSEAAEEAGPQDPLSDVEAEGEA